MGAAGGGAGGVGDRPEVHCVYFARRRLSRGRHLLGRRDLSAKVDAQRREHLRRQPDRIRRRACGRQVRVLAREPRMRADLVQREAGCRVQLQHPAQQREDVGGQLPPQLVRRAAARVDVLAELVAAPRRLVPRRVPHQ